MKKYIGLLIGLLFVLCPLFLKAEEKEKIDLSKYNTLNLTQTLDDEEIAKEFKNYEETDDQVTIYMFRGKGCGYCRAFINFINSITTEYGDKFKLVSFEAWYDKENSLLLDEISTFMGEKATGVPYIIIGDKVFPGYASNYDEDIKKEITTLYNSKDRYDVFEEYNNEIDDAKKAKNAGFNKVILWNIVLIALATTIIILYVKSSNERLLNRIEEMRVKKPLEETPSVVKKVPAKTPAKKPVRKTTRTTRKKK